MCSVVSSSSVTLDWSHKGQFYQTGSYYFISHSNNKINTMIRLEIDDCTNTQVNSWLHLHTGIKISKLLILHYIYSSNQPLCENYAKRKLPPQWTMIYISL